MPMNKKPKEEQKKIPINKEHIEMAKLILCFSEDGDVFYYTDRGEPEFLAERIAYVVDFLHQHPILIRGICGLRASAEPYDEPYTDLEKEIEDYDN